MQINTEKSLSLHTIYLKSKTNEATLCLQLQWNIFFYKHREITFSAHNLSYKQKTDEATLCLQLQLNIFFSVKRLGI